MIRASHWIESYVKSRFSKSDSDHPQFMRLGNKFGRVCLSVYCPVWVLTLESQALN